MIADLKETISIFGRDEPFELREEYKVCIDMKPPQRIAHPIFVEPDRFGYALSKRDCDFKYQLRFFPNAGSREKK